MKLSYTVDINNTPENIFYWLNNPKRAMVWQSGVSKTEIFHETPNMIGTTFREIIEENGRGVEMRGVVTDYRENQLIAMHLSGKFNVVDVEWRLEEIEDYTHLTVSSNIRFRSFMKVLSIILWPAFRKKIIGQLQGEFAKLKEICERDTQSYA